MAAAGSISADEFRSLAEKFADTSSKIDDGWHLEILASQDSVYLWRKSILPRSSQSNEQQKESQKDPGSAPPPVPSGHVVTPTKMSETTEICAQLDGQQLNVHDWDEMEMEEDEDEQCMPTVLLEREVLTYEYHILYSESYAVPVLYVNIYKQDGKLVPLDTVWEMSPSSFQKLLGEDKWTILTQQEHPLLGRPFLQLHPCHTGDLMSQVLKNSAGNIKQNYLATWLSTVGPMVGLHISPNYIT
ncbi:ubiquitin-like-conjugating enzyme ATG10 [Aplysia californica]|uniref:Ubiquitin-like-conjugating enzyme ATG10 n=1 Tax=Aplysia californica TaxID=6500 RepID=A0ABM0KAI6_APLCA|nr:ubiquitin-like-conjugating enzyme ATG10 [Aplysia californica]